MSRDGPKILIIDIETMPALALIFQAKVEFVGHSQIIEPVSVASWAAKWKGKKEVFYQATRGQKNPRDDKKILKGIAKLLEEADVIVTQNGKSFDEKVLNARFEINNIPEPAPFKHADTKQMAKRRFRFMHNSLEALCNDLDTPFKKMKTREFHGIDLQRACLDGNDRAWDEMEKYNKRDVQATEGVYDRLAPWGVPGINFNAFRSDCIFRCQCGSADLVKRGEAKNRTGIYNRYSCKSCGAWTSDSGAARNKMSIEKRDSLKGK